MTKFVRIVAAAVLVSAVLPSAQRRELVHPA